MSEPSAAPASEWVPPPQKSFSTLVTVLCSIVVVLYIGLLGRPLVEPRVSPLAELEYPEESLERLVTRELDLRAAMRGGPRWEGRLYRALSGDDDPLSAAGRWYQELVDLTGSPVAELHRVILLGEAGRTAKVREVLAGGGARDPSRERMAVWVTAAYLAPPPTPEAGRALILQIDDALPPSWFADTLIRRIAGRIGDAGGPRPGRVGHSRPRPRPPAPRAGAHGGLACAPRRGGARPRVDAQAARQHRGRHGAAARRPGAAPTAMPSSCAGSVCRRPSRSSASSCSVTRPGSAPSSGWRRTCRCSCG